MYLSTKTECNTNFIKHIEYYHQLKSRLTIHALFLQDYSWCNFHSVPHSIFLRNWLSKPDYINMYIILILHQFLITIPMLQSNHCFYKSNLTNFHSIIQLHCKNKTTLLNTTTNTYNYTYQVLIFVLTK